MGKEINGNNGEVSTDVKTSTGGTTGANGQGNSNNSTSTNSTGARGRGNRGTGTGTGATGTTEKENVPKLVSIDLPVTDDEKAEQKKEQRRIRDRENYAKKKTGTTKSTKQESVIDSNQLSVLLITVSAILGSKPNMEHWLLTDKEVEQIATPLSKMIAKSESISNMTEHVDAIALIIACATILVPRVLLSVENKKKIKKVVNTNGTNQSKQIKATSDIAGTNKGASQPNIGHVTSNSKNDSQNILEIIGY